MKKFLALSLLFFSINSFAQLDILKSSDEDFVYSNYYKIKVDPRATDVDLMNYESINETFPLPSVPYNRQNQFGGWLVDSASGSCLNTRGKVLVRDSDETPTYTSNGCTVRSGHWNEPYTGRLHTQAKDIQIDHLVALKNAYMTGAHEWDFNKRCLYANFMGNKFHLISADGPENLKKSDYTPMDYIPPNQSYTCQFVKQWLNIKLIWDLRITPREGDAIQKIAADNNCPHDMFKVQMRDLDDQHRYIQDHANMCASATAVLTAFE